MIYESYSYPIVGKGLKVVERRQNGVPNGEYIGYWQPNRRIIVLYPAPGSWIYGKLQKKTINEWELNVKKG